MDGRKIGGWLTGRSFSVGLIALLALLMAMEGSWAMGFPYHWACVALLALVMLSLGFAAIRDFRSFSYYALISHTGLFLVLAGGLLGMECATSAYVKVYTDRVEHIAIDADGNIVPLPFSISLDSFNVDYYEDGVSPKQFTSRVIIDGEKFSIGVNSPCKYKGYGIYQSGYDIEYGSYSILKVVRDPWLPIAAAGAVLLAAGAMLGLRTAWNSWKILLAALVLGTAFAVISLMRIKLGTLVPALRSLWFVPHLIIYMLAYAILALAAISGTASLFTDKLPSALPRRLLSTASSLLLLGMLCGAAWAKQAWGEYWTWDAKECWAAATWLLTVAGTHIRHDRRKLALMFTIISFLAMQMTWYGVNYLPSSDRSLHTYNRKF